MPCNPWPNSWNIVVTSSNVHYPLFTGASTPRDFVEFPSQFNENWALDPKVFAIDD